MKFEKRDELLRYDNLYRKPKPQNYPDPKSSKPKPTQNPKLKVMSKTQRIWCWYMPTANASSI